jgi:spore coat polysaccharide biosynthesis protein SpsF
VEKVLLITQARMGSTRLPGKVMKKIGGDEVLRIHLQRISKCKNVTNIIVATTTDRDDDFIFESVTNWGYAAYRGSDVNVLDRYYQAAKTDRPDWIVRVTSDCPLIDPELIDGVITSAFMKQVDYCANNLVEEYPDGQDVEIFTFRALEEAWKNAVKLSEKEHVTPYIRNNSDFLGGKIFKASNYPSPDNYSFIRMTLDEENDFIVLTALIEALGIDKSWLEYTQYIKDHALMAVNKDITRNAGLLKSINDDKPQ